MTQPTTDQFVTATTAFSHMRAKGKSCLKAGFQGFAEAHRMKE